MCVHRYHMCPGYQPKLVGFNNFARSWPRGFNRFLGLYFLLSRLIRNASVLLGTHVLLLAGRRDCWPHIPHATTARIIVRFQSAATVQRSLNPCLATGVHLWRLSVTYLVTTIGMGCCGILARIGWMANSYTVKLWADMAGRVWALRAQWAVCLDTAESTSLKSVPRTGTCLASGHARQS